MDRRNRKINLELYLQRVMEMEKMYLQRVMTQEQVYLQRAMEKEKREKMMERSSLQMDLDLQ